MEHFVLIGNTYHDGPFAGKPIGYGYRIKWGDNSFAVQGQPSPEEAKAMCIEWATKHGWTPPKWWQFWRWGDTKP